MQQCFSNALGTYGAIGTAVLAIIIIFSTANVYTTGISRVIYATAKQGGLPKMLNRVHCKTLVPHRTQMHLLVLSWLTLTIFYVFHVDIETGLLIPRGAAILVYIIGSSSGIKFLRISGIKKAFPWISLLISLSMVIFVGVLVIISLAFAATGYAYMKWELGQQPNQNTSTLKK